MLSTVKYQRLLAIAATVIILGSTFVLIGSRQLGQPSFEVGKYIMDGEEHVFMPPMLIWTEDSKFIEIEITMVLPIIHHTNFIITPDDCLHELTINGHKYEPNNLPYCDFIHGMPIDLGKYVKSGENVIHARLFNYGGQAKLLIKPALSDGLSIGMFIAYIAILIACVFLIAVYFKIISTQLMVLMILLYGFAIRLIYIACTSAYTRGHDVDGHIEYIKYIASHWSIPPLKGGWEFYHPPLYYFFGSLWYQISDFLGFADVAKIRGLQWFAFFVSICVLLLCAWIGYMLFRKQKFNLSIFLGICSMTPGIVFFSSRVNNDVLAHLMMFSSFALLIYWWKRQRNDDWRLWLFVITITGLGILSKSNVIVILPIAYILLAAHKKYSIKQKLVFGYMGILIITVLTGWYFAYRIFFEKQSHMIENSSNLNYHLQIKNTPENFFEFNPVRMVFHPYNNAWDDSEGRQFFFEYLFRSAFFGEFDHGKALVPLAQLLILMASLLCIPLVLNFWRTIRHKDYELLPVWLCFIIVMMSHLALRIFTPSSPAQDFRLSPLLLIPCAYFAIKGIDDLKGWVRVFFKTCLFLFISLCILFILLLCLQ